jgi:hypothetical protein
MHTRRLPGVPRGFLLLIAAALLAGCGPYVTLENKTDVGIKFITNVGGEQSATSVFPGETSSATGSDYGSYSISVIPNEDWLAWARDFTNALSDQLKHGRDLTPEDVQRITRNLATIREQMAQFEKLAKDAGATCSGKTSDEKSSVVTVTRSDDGKLIVTCS